MKGALLTIAVFFLGVAVAFMPVGIFWYFDWNQGLLSLLLIFTGICGFVWLELRSRKQ